jgi:MoxR-like ATPase
MKRRYYRGEGKTRSDEMETLPKFRKAEHLLPDRYIADSGLADAVNVALLLQQPLLLTGEPGTGKTQLAYSLAWERGLGDPLKFETKSSSNSRDLFYLYDSIGRFQAAQSGGSTSASDYITFNALGLAILRATRDENARKLLPEKWRIRDAQRSVVLIDEVDKAPRDFPNDILNELDQMYFRVPEMANQMFQADDDMRPLVIITSNSEKDLPDAFLRRCVYYNVPFPEREHAGRMKAIIESRLGTYANGSSEFLDDALDLFYTLREPQLGLRKRPATAELLGWMIFLREQAPGEASNPLAADPQLALRTVSCLVKTGDDQRIAVDIVKKWLEKRPK